jgi:PAS domain S-box-containing protein
MGTDTPPALEHRHARRSVNTTGFAGRDDIFFAAVEMTRMPMVVTDPNLPDNPIVFANEAFINLSGYEPEEIIGRNCRFMQGPETNPDTVAALRRALEARTEISIEILNYRKDGSTFWNALFLSPVFNSAGELLYFFGSQLDVSRRHDAEAALRQSQKLEAIGQLTGGLAHDFNNLLTVVVGNLEQALPRAQDERLRTLLHRAIEAAGRGAQLTHQLLAFARKQRLDDRPINLNDLVLGLKDMVERTLGAEITFETRLAPDLVTCRIDPTQAELALLNIMLNARDAMAGSGRVVIETGNRTVSAAEAHEHLPPGHYATLSVSDTGRGMSPEIRSRVFEPFFTTKEVGKGSGMGLAMVYGFVRQSRGHITLDSSEGVGTTVRMYFPEVEQPARAEPGRSAGTLPVGGRERVLVVEDNADVLELAESILSDLGYEVVKASNAQDALDQLEGPDGFDLLFSDVVMPGGVNGITLARQAVADHPRLKVLLTTGFSEGHLAQGGRVQFPTIGKPYRRTELARKVRQVLDTPPEKA